MTVRLRPGEPALGRGAPVGQLASIDLSAYAAQPPYPVLSGAYGQLAAESPPAPAAPTPLPRPEPQQGTDLSYALQWVAFAVLMPVGFGYAARQQARNDEADATADAAARDRAGAHAGSHSPEPAEALGQAGRPPGTTQAGEAKRRRGGRDPGRPRLPLRPHPGPRRPADGALVSADPCGEGTQGGCPVGLAVGEPCFEVFFAAALGEDLGGLPHVPAEAFEGSARFQHGGEPESGLGVERVTGVSDLHSCGAPLRAASA